MAYGPRAPCWGAGGRGILLSTPGLLPRLLEQGIHSDVVFMVHGRSFRAHRCILGARSAYFANMLDTKWKGKSVVVLRHPLVGPWFGVGVSRGLVLSDCL